MDAPQIIRRLHEHRMWVNAQLLEAAESLTAAQLQQPFAIGQGSIWKTLLHLYAGEYVWLEALFGNERPVTPGDLPDRIPGNQGGDGAVTSLIELRKRWAELDQRWRSYLESMSAESLENTVYKVRMGFGKEARHGTRRADVLLHVCTHAQYTTAQAVNMLRHVGVTNLPDAMLITLARREFQNG